MAKRGRKRGGFNKAKTNYPAKTQSAATSISNFATPRVHPANNDCYPLNKLCRLCLLSNTNMEPIFPYQGDKRLAQKIFQCTNLEIKENPDQGIPNSICGQCKKQLDQCYEFRLLCWKNDEILHNLHAILSPHRKTQYRPPAAAVGNSRSNPFVQVQKLDLSSLVTTTPKRGRKGAQKSYGEIPLNQLFTPSRFGHMGARAYPQFSRELVVRLTPLSASLVNKYKKAAAAARVTQTKAAMKSFPQTTKGRGRPPKAEVKTKPAKIKAKVIKAKIKVNLAKALKPKKTKAKAKAKAEKKQKQPKVSKAKRAEFSVPPKKRKQNFETAPPTVATATCILCSQTFNSVKSLGRHMAAHENGRKNNSVFNCDICKKEFLKGSQFSDHLDSPEHMSNAARQDANEGEVSILPDGDEPEVSILPDDADDERILPNDSGAGMNDSVESTENPEPEPEPEEITDSAEPAPEARPQPSPDTNDNSQQEESSQLDESAEPECLEASGEEQAADDLPPPAEAISNRDRDASPIPVDSESSRSREGGVQYSDVCSTNNAENLFNGSGAEALNSSRRVTFSDITEIVE